MSAKSSLSLKVLIIGGDAALAGPLQARLENSKHSTIATTRRKDQRANRCCLDLSETLEFWQPPAGVSKCVLLAAISKLDHCEADPDLAMRVNAKSQISIASKLCDRGIKSLFISTNQVFDGTRPQMPSDAVPKPKSVYGLTKEAGEKGILALGGCVLRLSKVIDAENSLINGWLHSLQNGEVICPFEDAFMAPVSLAQTIEAMMQIIEIPQPEPLIYQLSATRDISYSEIAIFLAEAIGAPLSLVQPLSSVAAGWQGPPFPRNTTLDTVAIEKAGIVPRDPREVIAETFRLVSPG